MYFFLSFLFVKNKTKSGVVVLYNIYK